MMTSFRPGNHAYLGRTTLVEVLEVLGGQAHVEICEDSGPFPKGTQWQVAIRDLHLETTDRALRDARMRVGR